MGADLSIGLEYIENTSTESNFNITGLRGPSADTNVGVNIIDVSLGGNTNDESSAFFSKTGNKYQTNTGGISFSGSQASLTRTFELMKVGVIKSGK